MRLSKSPEQSQLSCRIFSTGIKKGMYGEGRVDIMFAKWVKKQSLRYKLMFSFFFIFLLVMAIISISYLDRLNNIRSGNIDHMLKLNAQVNATFNAVLSSPEQLKYIQIYDQSYRNILQHSDVRSSSTEEHEKSQYIENAIKHAVFYNPNIVRASIFSHDVTYSSVNSDINEYKQKILKTVNETTWDSDTKTIYTGVYKTNIDLNPYYIITIICPLYEYGNKSALGILAVDIDFRRVCNAFEESVQQTKGCGFTVLSKNDLVYQSSVSPISLKDHKKDQKNLLKEAISLLDDKEQYHEITMGKRKIFITALENETSGWIIIQYQSKQELFEKSTNDLKKILLLIVFLILLFMGISYLLAATISHPLELLDATITSNQKGPLKEIPIEKPLIDNDMNRVLNNYNHMVDRINDSTQKEIKYEIMKQKMQVRILRYQINPHFLYNTLNIINSIAQIEGVDSICKVSRSLSQIMRYNVQGGDTVSVAQEIKNAKDYLDIQTIRFPDKFEFQFYIESGTESLIMIKFVLQPILENAITHGLKNKSGGKIGIDVYTSLDQLFIVVWDNGGNISKDEAERWNIILQDDTASNMMDESGKNEWDSIGFRNVNARIKGYYGNEYGLSIETSDHNITKIRFHLHIKERG